MQKSYILILSNIRFVVKTFLIFGAPQDVALRRKNRGEDDFA